MTVLNLRNPSGTGYYGWFAVRCDDCKKIVTKHNFSPEDALRDAVGHKCLAATTETSGGNI